MLFNSLPIAWIIFKFSFFLAGITIRLSNSLDPDQALHFVGPGLGPNCLQRCSADDKSDHKGETSQKQK